MRSGSQSAHATDATSSRRAMRRAFHPDAEFDGVRTVDSLSCRASSMMAARRATSAAMQRSFSTSTSTASEEPPAARDRQRERLICRGRRQRPTGDSGRSAGFDRVRDAAPNTARDGIRVRGRGAPSLTETSRSAAADASADTSAFAAASKSLRFDAPVRADFAPLNSTRPSTEMTATVAAVPQNSARALNSA